MLIQVKTANHRTTPNDYMSGKLYRERYEKWEGKMEIAYFHDGTIDSVYNWSGKSVLAEEPNGYDHPDAEIVVIIVDDYIH